MYRVLVVRLIAAIAGLLVGLTAHAQEARASNPTDSAEPCDFTEEFVPPSVPGWGRFAYKAVITVHSGKTENVEVSTDPRIDRASNRLIEDAIRQHVKTHFNCTGDKILTQHFVLNMDHEVLSKLDDLLPELLAERDAHQAQVAASATISAPRSSAWKRANCQIVGTPPILRGLGSDTAKFHILLEVRNDAVGFVDVRMMMGSSDLSLNQSFISTVTAWVRSSFHCEGTHLIETDVSASVERRSQRVL